MRLGLYQVACKTTLEQVEGQAEALAFQLLDQLGDVVRAGYTGIAESFQAMATELGKVRTDPPAQLRTAYSLCWQWIFSQIASLKQPAVHCRHVGHRRQGAS